LIVGFNNYVLFIKKGSPFEFDPVPFYARRSVDKKKDAVAKLPFYAYDFFYRPYLEFKNGFLFDSFKLAEVEEPELAKEIEEEVKRLSAVYSKSQKLKEGELPPLDYPSKIKPYPHQRIATSLLILNPEYALFMEQGTGKTKSLIDALNYLYIKEGVSKVVIFAPISVIYSTWIKEIEKNQTVPFKVFPAIDGSRKERTAVINRWLLSTKDKLNYLFLSYDFWWRLLPIFRKLPGEVEGARYFGVKFKGYAEKLKKLFSQARFSSKIRKKLIAELEFLAARSSGKFRKLFSDALLALQIIDQVEVTVADESHKIKNSSSKRAKGIYYLSWASKRKYLLTGTPITRSPMDIYGQFLFFHPVIFRSREAFRAYFIDSYDSVERVNFSTREEFKKLVDGFSFIVEKEDVLKDLPPKRFLTRDVVLSKETTKLYLEVERELVAKVRGLRREGKEDEAIVIVSHIFSLIRKLNQLASGFVIDADGKPIAVSKEKLEVIEDILEERGRKQTVIWSVHNFEVERIREFLEKRGWKVAKLDGTVPSEVRKEIVNAFQDGNFQVLVANPLSAGTGLNLTAADAAIYSSLDYKLDAFLQSQDRIHRIGQEAERVDYFILLSRLNSAVKGVEGRANFTIDRRIYERLLLKEEMVDEVLSVDERRNLLNAAFDYVEQLEKSSNN
jgi:SNF2 family DNA or RNA helicase